MIIDTQRIERFQKMTQADPENELGHFSLARAYIDNELLAEAVPELLKVLELNTTFSKAYALLGQVYSRLGRLPEAVETLTKGYQVAHERGDLMPRNDMGRLLKELGAAIPEVKVEELSPEEVATGLIKCRRCGRAGPKMAERPFRGTLGETIHECVCAPCFKEWIGQGTKVINELRLNLTDKVAQDIYDQHMKEFLNLE